jgi:hypothetical protein
MTPNTAPQGATITRPPLRYMTLGDLLAAPKAAPPASPAR